MEDRRAKKTKRAIKQTFLDLLKTHPINKISVSEITRIADIGRGTFYFHYLDVYDLLEKIEDEICDDLSAIFDEVYTAPSDFNALFLAIIDYISGHNEQFSLLMVQEANSSKLMQKMRQLFVNKIGSLIPEKMMDNYHKIRILFIVSGVVGIIDDWLRRDFKIGKDVICFELGKIMGAL